MKRLAVLTISAAPAQLKANPRISASRARGYWGISSFYCSLADRMWQTPTWATILPADETLAR
jgi:hypothetical protein